MTATAVKSNAEKTGELRISAGSVVLSGELHCRARSGSNFCSEKCEKARDQTDCSCGHPECEARA